MQTRQLGRSDVAVSVIALGCWALVGDQTWGAQERTESVRTVQAALDAGITLFDTAEMYGNGVSEEIVGEALRGRRHEAVIASKVSPENLAPGDLRAACERSLRRLQTDYLDVYYIHWPNREVPIAQTLGMLAELQQEGKVRAVACSNFASGDLADLLAHGRVEANQLPYSLLWRAIEYGVQEACERESIGITCYSPLAQGLLTGKFKHADEVPPGRARTRLFSSQRPLARHHEPGAEAEAFAAIEAIASICRKYDLDMTWASLAWLIAQRGVASVIVGARTPEQARNNAQAGGMQLPDAVLAELTQATDALKERLGPNPDMWESPSRMR